MSFLWKTFLKGLVTILPIGLTVYLLYWLTITIENLLRPIILLVIPDTYYWTGMGLLAGIILLFFIGLAVNAWLVKRLIDFGESLINRVPLVKTIYNSIKDFMDFFAKAKSGQELNQVVMVNINDLSLIGFVTATHVDNLPGFTPSTDTIAVYLPMSYQVGGFTVYLSKDKVQPLDMKMDKAMRHVLTAGLSK